jgi:hypothetical protein
MPELLPLYESYRPFRPSDGDVRIFAPASYPVVREAQLVPIVHIEAFALAEWFPICWQIVDGQPTLVALRTLCQDGSHQPHGSPAQPSSLPLVLKAYPFVVGLSSEGKEEGHYHLVEAPIPDKPSDVGAPILTPTGKAGAGTSLKLHAVSAFNDALPLTKAMTGALAENDLFEPWPLEFDVSGRTLTVKNLFIVRQSEFGSTSIFQFVKTFGPAGASFLGAHRISLFRAGVLVRAAGNTDSGIADTSDRK